MESPRRHWIDRISGRLERAVEAPQNLLFGGRAVTESALERLLHDGIDGQATILAVPNKHGVSRVAGNTGRFRVRIQVDGQVAYECTIWQSFSYEEWERLPVGNAEGLPPHRRRRSGLPITVGICRRRSGLVSNCAYCHVPRAQPGTAGTARCCAHSQVRGGSSGR